MDERSAIDHFPSDGVVETTNPAGAGGYVLVCEHASNFIPDSLHNLGLGQAALHSHIAWDPGALDVARCMSNQLDAPLVASRVSRLVYDCNRTPGVQNAIPDESDGIAIPGNAGLSEADIERRKQGYYAPFHAALNSCIRSRIDHGLGCVMVTVHSFTPVHGGVSRHVELGVLHDRDSRLADRVLAIAGADSGLIVARNAPYGPGDGVTHTLVEHGLSHGLPNVMLEIRNDLLADPAARKAMAAQLCGWLIKATAGLGAGAGPRRAGGSGAV